MSFASRRLIATIERRFPTKGGMRRSAAERGKATRLRRGRCHGRRSRWRTSSATDADEFIRRFLNHVLPDGFHRIRHYGLFANANRASNIALARRLLGVPDATPSSRQSDDAENGYEDEDWNACPRCGGHMIIVEIFEPGCRPRFWPVPSIGLDSS
jgi:hypothetical protein